MATTLVSGMLMSSWRSNYFQLPVPTQQNTLLHIVALEQAYQDFFIPQVEMPENQDIFNEYLNSQFWIARFLLEIGSYQLAMILLERVVTHRKECFGLEHLNTLNSMGDLAAVY